MANETIGTVRCPFCGGTGEVRKNVRGKWYFIEPADRCGIVQPNGKQFQQWIREHAHIASPADAPPPAPAPAPEPPKAAPAPAPAPTPAPKPKGGGWTLLG